MANFVEEIAQSIGLPIALGFRLVNFGGKAVFVEGIFGVLSFSSNRVLIKIGQGMCEILGEELHIKSLSKDDIIVCGKILTINQLA